MRVKGVAEMTRRRATSKSARGLTRRTLLADVLQPETPVVRGTVCSEPLVLYHMMPDRPRGRRNARGPHSRFVRCMVLAAPQGLRSSGHNRRPGRSAPKSRDRNIEGKARRTERAGSSIAVKAELLTAASGPGTGNKTHKGRPTAPCWFHLRIKTQFRSAFLEATA